MLRIHCLFCILTKTEKKINLIISIVKEAMFRETQFVPFIYIRIIQLKKEHRNHRTISNENNIFNGVTHTKKADLTQYLSFPFLEPQSNCLTMV